MIKKLIIAVFVCGVLWGLIRQLNHMPDRSKLANQPNKEQINNTEIRSTAVPGKKFIPDEIRKPKNVVTAEAAHVISDNQIKTNPKSDGNIAARIDIHGDKIIQTDADTPLTANINFTWNGVKLIALTATAKHSDNAQNKKISLPEAANNTKVNTDISKQESQSEDQSGTEVKTDKVRCPSVENIQLEAQKISEAILVNGIYAVMTSDPAFQDSDLTWLVDVKIIAADSSDEAIYKAIIAVSETNYHKIEYAEIMEGMEVPVTLYFCS